MSRDLGKNPGPTRMYVDTSKTIAAPYHQDGLWTNTRQQRVATSLYPLIYSKTRGIRFPDDLILIMNIENQLYSNLSQLSRQSF